MKKKILVLNGPNLNLLGKRETDIYGDQSFESFFDSLASSFENIELSYFQSNSEGAIIDKIHEVGYQIDGIVLNAGAYTHTSIAISDAIAGVTSPVVEVHISNVYKREAYRHHSYLAKNCLGVISGFGLHSYKLAIDAILNL